MKKNFLALLLAIPATGLSAPKKVTVATDPGDAWPAAARSLMEKAAQIVFDRINDHDVAQCAYRNAFRENTDKVRRQWSSQITVLNKNGEVTLRILKKKLDRSILGLAQLNKARVDPEFFRIHHLEIILNETNLNQFADQYPTADGGELGIWVNTIAHELAHNFGYRHGHSGVWARDYPGYFPTELGFCVMTQGKHGSDLGDYELRRKFKEAR
ncbi:hypothetical protein [Oligoflexus tunisiensis]|uniref:hypothetical protein n=1 Tax=Oligoflexus tunisiensis TaxID=708132 RepID=UPI00114D187A|nr:hypothetical protein [Oligoflexus tunisiensis]